MPTPRGGGGGITINELREGRPKSSALVLLEADHERVRGWISAWAEGLLWSSPEGEVGCKPPHCGPWRGQGRLRPCARACGRLLDRHLLRALDVPGTTRPIHTSDLMLGHAVNLTALTARDQGSPDDLSVGGDPQHVGGVDLRSPRKGLGAVRPGVERLGMPGRHAARAAGKTCTGPISHVKCGLCSAAGRRAGSW
jgi:hypothetical protein